MDWIPLLLTVSPTLALILEYEARRGTGGVIVVVYVVTVCVDAAVVYIRGVVLIVARRA